MEAVTKTKIKQPTKKVKKNTANEVKWVSATKIEFWWKICTFLKVMETSSGIF